MVIKHLVNGEWVEVRQNKLAEAFDHAAAHGSAFPSGLYKITTNSQGHVTNVVAVSKNDLVQYGLLDAGSVAATYDENDSYVEGEFCIYNGKLYKALTDVDGGAFDSSKWEEANVLIAAGSGGTVVAGESDWNAQEGEPGYIKNKPTSLGGGNWNSSEGEPGYIENRTHYTETVVGEVNVVVEPIK